jgi:hypothetical protein
MSAVVHAQSALPPPSNATYVPSYVNQVVNPYVQCWSEGYFIGTICFRIGDWFCTTSEINFQQSYTLTVGYEFDGVSFSYSHSWTAGQSFGPHTAGAGEHCAYFRCFPNARLRKWTCRRQFSFWSWTTTDYTFVPQAGDDGATVMVYCEPNPCGAGPGDADGPTRAHVSARPAQGSAPPWPSGATLTINLANYFTITSGAPPPTHPINNDSSSLAGLNTWQLCQIQHSISSATMLEGVPIVQLTVLDTDGTPHHFDLVANPNPFNLPLPPQSENFDGYANGSQMHGQGGWRGWDNSPAAGAPVSQAQARSGAQSVEIDGAADLIHEFCTAGHGAWSYTAWQFIPSNFSANSTDPYAGSYFILLDSYQDAGPYHWAVQMVADSNDGMMKVYYGQGVNTLPVPYETNRWVKIKAIIDLDDDWTRVYYDDALVAQYPWTGGVLGDSGGALDIGAVDLFANGSSPVYYDDLLFEPLAPPPPCRADCTGTDDGEVRVGDLLALLAQWGGAGSCDLNGDGVIDVADLLELLADWGKCL